MRIVYTFVFYLAVNAIEFSSQSSSNSPDNIHPSSWRLSSSRRICESPAQPEPSLRARTRSPPAAFSPVQPPIRARSRSPPAYASPATSHSASPLVYAGYGLGQLGLIRLIPYDNPYQQFEFRRYTFCRNSRLVRTLAKRVYSSVPLTEQIVLATSNGDVFAILEASGALSGIYRTYTGRPRVKINIGSGVVTELTPNEVKQCPVGPTRLIHINFSIVVVNQDSLQLNQ